MKKTFSLICLILMCTLFMSSCGKVEQAPSQKTEQTPEASKELEKSEAPADSAQTNTNKNIILSTTTSTSDSGLLDFLLPVFEKDTGFSVDVIAVGSGKALQMGVDGEADVLLVHAKQDEEKFVSEGHAKVRYDVMYNDFIIVGSEEDPANSPSISPEATEVFKMVAENKKTFVSRGDDSGTHKKELAIWKKAGIEPQGDWYVSAGKGMADVLIMADEFKGYTLTDRATFLSMRDKLNFSTFFEGDKELLNYYGVLPVNPDKNEQINAEGAEAFIDWILSEKGQQLIGEFGKEKFGTPLFFPNAKN